MPVRAKYILEAGNSQRRVNFEQSRRQSLRFCVMPSKRTARSSDTQSCMAMWQLPQSHSCPGYGFIMPSRKEMSVRHAFLHPVGERINGTQSHSMRKAFDGPIWFAEPHLDKSAGRPPQRQVRINQHCTVEKGSAIVNLSADISERVSGETECGSVVLTQLHSQSSQSFSFGHLLLSVDDPA